MAHKSKRCTWGVPGATTWPPLVKRFERGFRREVPDKAGSCIECSARCEQKAGGATRCSRRPEHEVGVMRRQGWIQSWVFRATSQKGWKMIEVSRIRPRRRTHANMFCWQPINDPPKPQRRRTPNASSNNSLSARSCGAVRRGPDAACVVARWRGGGGGRDASQKG